MNVLEHINSLINANKAKIEEIRSNIPTMNAADVAVATAKIEELRNANDQFNTTVSVMAEKLNNTVESMCGVANDSDYEYRYAQMNYIMHGTQSELLERAATTVSDNAIVVKSTLYNKIITKATSYGTVSNKAKLLHVKGGIKIPRGMTEASVSWGDDTLVVDAQAMKVLGAIAFTSNKLTLSVSRTELETLEVIEAFEDKLAETIAQALAKAKDWAEFNGKPENNQPLGILNDPDITNTITFTDSTISDYVNHIGLTDELNEKYQNGVYVMTRSTFNTLKKVQDPVTGDYIAYVATAADGAKNYYGDHEVVLVENDILPSWKSCGAGECFIVYFKLDNYIFNLQQDLILDTYMEKPSRNIRTDAVYYIDGRIEDPYGVIKFIKG